MSCLCRAGRLINIAWQERRIINNMARSTIDPTWRALFRAAGAEMTLKQTPPKVVISEFVGVAEAFSADGKEPKFVNAVLDHMAREAQPEAFSS